jgi:hypothetical protein
MDKYNLNMAELSNRSAGIKEALSVSVPDFGTMRVSVSPARQTGGFWQIPRPGWLSGEEVKREWHRGMPLQVIQVAVGIAHPDPVSSLAIILHHSCYSEGGRK